jgi:hypothetical protein
MQSAEFRRYCRAGDAMWKSAKAQAKAVKKARAREAFRARRAAAVHERTRLATEPSQHLRSIAAETG